MFLLESSIWALDFMADPLSLTPQDATALAVVSQVGDLLDRCAYPKCSVEAWSNDLDSVRANLEYSLFAKSRISSKKKNLHRIMTRPAQPSILFGTRNNGCHTSVRSPALGPSRLLSLCAIQLNLEQDDEDTIQAKIKFANSLGLGGLLIWSIDQDDDQLTALNAVLKPKSVSVSSKSTEWDVS